MQKHLLKIGVMTCATLFAFARVGTVNASSVQANDGQTQTTGNYGYVTPNIVIPKSENSGKLKTYKSANLPSRYDLRQQNRITSVKNQGNNGTCWAYAALSSAESSLMPNQNLDFSASVRDMQYNAGFDFGPQSGGNDYMSIAYFARWSGPVTQNGVQEHIQNVDWVPSRSGYGDSNEDGLIKQTIMNHGAITAGIYYDGAYYNSNTHSYFNRNSRLNNHEIDIVGWDDNYSAANFSGTASGIPPHNGAFICKNSWGTGWGDNGFFYVSYDDANIGSSGFSAYDVSKSADNYNNIYQYDTLGYTCSTYAPWMANVFTSQNDSLLSAVSFYTLSQSVGYNVYAIPKYSGYLTGGTLVASGTIQDAGYHTVDFSTKLLLTKGTQFAVVVQFTQGNMEAAIEKPNAGYSSKATASAGQSYISYDRYDWTDLTNMYPNTNVCLKAFTTSADISPKMNIDSPSDSAQSGNITVAGWALNRSGIQRLDIYMDVFTNRQKFYSTTANSARPDVKNAIDPYGCFPNSSNSGFRVTIPVNDVTPGKHTLSIAAIGNDGSVQWSSRDFIEGPDSQMSVDSPSGTQTGNVNVSGWALNHSGIQRVDIYMDVFTNRQKFYSTTANSARSDVKSIVDPHGTYIGSDNSGFGVTIPVNDVTSGKHTLSIAAIGNDGSVQWSSRDFIEGPDSQMSVDSPSGTQTGNVNVSGWALNHSGIQRVDIYMDLGTNHTKGYSTLAKNPRPDVKSIVDPHGNYIGSSNSGFYTIISSKDLTPGQHTLSIAAIGNDGSVQWNVSSFMYQ